MISDRAATQYFSTATPKRFLIGWLKSRNSFNLVVFIKFSLSGYTEKILRGKALGLTESQLPHEPASVEAAEEASWTSGASRPERFEQAVADDADGESVTVTFDSATRVFGLEEKNPEISGLWLMRLMSCPRQTKRGTTIFIFGSRIKDTDIGF